MTLSSDTHWERWAARRAAATELTALWNDGALDFGPPPDAYIPASDAEEAATRRARYAAMVAGLAELDVELTEDELKP